MGRPQKHPIKLGPDDHARLQHMVRQGRDSARVIRRAHTLLLAHEGHPDTFIGNALHVDRGTVASTRRRYLQDGLDAALVEGKRPRGKPKLNHKQQAMLIAIACSDAPDGRESWNMQLLADRLIELGVVTDISDETVRRALKKTNSNRGINDTGASPG